jgi:putative hydrolase of HD superfamily
MPADKGKIKNIVNYFFELGILRKEDHDGLKLIGVSDLDSVAEHALRAAQIGYILTVLENQRRHLKLNPEKVAAIILFHDNGEIRIGDLHRVASKYIDSRNAEKAAFGEQCERLPAKVKKKLLEYFEEIEKRNTPEGVIAKDADWLEQAFVAKEYYDLGNKLAMAWIENVEKALETGSAKKIIREMKKTRFTDWWTGLPKNLYTKIDGAEISSHDRKKKRIS